MNRLKLLNGNFNIVTRAETISWIDRIIQKNDKAYLCTVNVAILMTMREERRLQEFVDNASLVVADGAPIVWYSRLSKSKIPERVTGIDLVEDLCEKSETAGHRIFLLGATQETLDAAATTILSRHPNVKIAGMHDGYFRAEDSEAVVNRINESNAQILLVAMGVPRQEHFIMDNWQSLDVNIAIPIGGSFEVIAGNKQRAPEFIQSIGMEWFYRLIQEPERLWKRYLTTGLQFIRLVSKEIFLGNPSFKLYRVEDPCNSDIAGNSNNSEFRKLL